MIFVLSTLIIITVYIGLRVAYRAGFERGVNVGFHRGMK
jgi:hypothetical protein